jgi:hypothetical protein
MRSRPPELRDLNAKLMEDCVHEVVDNAKLRGEFRYKERFRIRPDLSLIGLPDPDPDPYYFWILQKTQKNFFKSNLLQYFTQCCGSGMFIPDPGS